MPLHADKSPESYGFVSNCGVPYSSYTFLMPSMACKSFRVFMSIVVPGIFTRSFIICALSLLLYNCIFLDLDAAAFQQIGDLSDLAADIFGFDDECPVPASPRKTYLCLFESDESQEYEYRCYNCTCIETAPDSYPDTGDRPEACCRSKARTLKPSRMMVPAPRKPMPLMTWAPSLAGSTAEMEYFLTRNSEVIITRAEPAHTSI